MASQISRANNQIQHADWPKIGPIYILIGPKYMLRSFTVQTALGGLYEDQGQTKQTRLLRYLLQGFKVSKRYLLHRYECFTEKDNSYFPYETTSGIRVRYFPYPH